MRQHYAQVLYLDYVKAGSLVLLARMSGFSVSAVESEARELHRKDLAEVKRQPRSILYDNLLVLKPAAAQESPPRRRHGRERRHDRT